MGTVFRAGIVVFFLLFLTQISAAGAVKIDKKMEKFVVDVMGAPITIERNQDTQHRLKNSYAKTSRPCPPFCVQTFQAVPGMTTVGELELIRFMKEDVSTNRGVLIDARMPKWYKQGTIPGAVNIPFSIFSKANGDRYINKLLPLLGAEKTTGGWNFDQAQRMVVFDNGPWCQQANLAIQNLLKLGYPKSKILYYRGGMQYWQVLGFTTLKPKL